VAQELTAAKKMEKMGGGGSYSRGGQGRARGDGMRGVSGVVGPGTSSVWRHNVGAVEQGS
jgi:hypothetical protein